jgi:hypothetical protein
MLAYVTFLFAFELLRVSTITTYLAGLQHELVTNDIPRSVWSKPLHQTIRGFMRDEVEFFPHRRHIKVPFTRSMIKTAYEKLLLKYYGANSILSLGCHASMCMGLMFLFRKSEYLTGKDKKVKKTNGLTVTLLAKNCQLWYDDGSSFKASEGRKLPPTCPVFLSIYLEATKNDQFGKGAQRFFPADFSNPECMVNIVYNYIRVADLQDDDPLFAGPHITVTDSMLANLLKATCVISGIKADLCSLHSLRVGGLVTLFAADVPDSLKQLAGRWKSPTSFVVYARATMAQFNQIAQALNNVTLVTAQHIKQFYQFSRLH